MSLFSLIVAGVVCGPLYLNASLRVVPLPPVLLFLSMIVVSTLTAFSPLSFCALFSPPYRTMLHELREFVYPPLITPACFCLWPASFIVRF